MEEAMGTTDAESLQDLLTEYRKVKFGERDELNGNADADTSEEFPSYDGQDTDDWRYLTCFGLYMSLFGGESAFSILITMRIISDILSFDKLCNDHIYMEVTLLSSSILFYIVDVVLTSYLFTFFSTPSSTSQCYQDYCLSVLLFTFVFIVYHVCYRRLFWNPVIIITRDGIQRFILCIPVLLYYSMTNTYPLRMDIPLIAAVTIFA